MTTLKDYLKEWCEEADHTYDNPRCKLQETFSREEYIDFYVSAKLEEWRSENQNYKGVHYG